MLEKSHLFLCLWTLFLLDIAPTPPSIVSKTLLAMFQRTLKELTPAQFSVPLALVTLPINHW